MPWTSTEGGTWEDKFRFTKGFCEHYIRELDRILETSETPKKSFPQDWAKREAVVHILNRIKEIEEEELGDPVEVLSQRFTHFSDVLIDGIKRTLEEQLPRVQTPPKKSNLGRTYKSVIEGINDLESEPNDVLTRKTEILLRQGLDLEQRVSQLEGLLKDVGRTISEQRKR